MSLRARRARVVEGSPRIRTGKATIATVIYSVTCPHCEGDVANRESGSLDFESHQSNGPLGDCTACDAVVAIPKKAQ